MQEYIEYIFLENFIVNFILLSYIKTFLKQKSKKVKFFFGSILMSIYSCIVYIYPAILNVFIVKILAILISIFVVFVPKSVARYLKIFGYYCMTYLLFLGTTIGVTLVFNFNISSVIQKIIVYLLSFIITYFISRLMWKVWKRSIKNSNFNIIIKIADEEIKGFVDTGNTVVGYNNKPVVFLRDIYEKKFREIGLLKDSYDIDITTINKTEKEKIYTLSKLSIKFEDKEKTFNNANVIFTNNIREYDALIGYELYLEVL